MKTKSMVRASAVLGSMIVGLAGFGASAATATIDRDPTKVADASTIRAAAEAEEDDSANCSKSRKRLWIEGEGWIVRKVTICR